MKGYKQRCRHLEFVNKIDPARLPPKASISLPPSSTRCLESRASLAAELPGSIHCPLYTPDPGHPGRCQLFLDAMATSPQDELHETEALPPPATRSTSSHSIESPLPSSVSWQSISHELANNEQIAAYEHSATNELGAIEHNQSFIPDLAHDSSEMDLSPLTLHTSWPLCGAYDKNDPSEPSFLPQDAGPILDRWWTNSTTDMVRPEMPAMSPSSSLEVHAGNSPETTSSFQQTAGSFEICSLEIPTNVCAGTPPALSELLGGLLDNNTDHSLDSKPLPKHVDGATQPLESTNALVCHYEGCGKAFDRQHRYKYVPRCS